jgi:hypothetical protein
MRRVAGVVCFILIGCGRLASGQQVSSEQPSARTFEIVPLTTDQESQLTTWLAEMEKWQHYDEKWRNRPVKDGWARIVDRKPPPGVPDWVPPHCASLAAAGLAALEERGARACRLLDDPRAPLAAPGTQAVAAEKPPAHSSFWTRVHLDGLWTTTQSGSRFYGVIGSHLSLVDVGRLQIFGPPGVMLMTVPNGHGGRRITIGYTWGLSVRLFDMRMAAPTKNVTLFLNVSKVFLPTGGEVADQTGRGFDIVGFSIAPRKKR